MSTFIPFFLGSSTSTAEIYCFCLLKKYGYVAVAEKQQQRNKTRDEKKAPKANINHFTQKPEKINAHRFKKRRKIKK